MNSWIDQPILGPNVRVESSPSLEMNLSVITPPSIRSQGVSEVWSQNLYGPEPSIDRVFEGGNLKLTM